MTKYMAAMFIDLTKARDSSDGVQGKHENWEQVLK